MQKALFPGYTVGPDAYEDIVNICSAYGKKAAIIGGRKALAAAEPQIRKAVEGSGIEITGTFWYGGEASRENMDMLRPQVADADMIFAVGGGQGRQPHVCDRDARADPQRRLFFKIRRVLFQIFNRFQDRNQLMIQLQTAFVHGAVPANPV